MAMAAQGVDKAEKEVQSQSLSGQGSVYNLTLSQVQNHLGEPLPGMNLQDLLRSVFPAGEDGRSPAADAGALSKKTVDEVWRQIQRGKEQERQQHPSLGEMTLEDFLCRAGVVGDAPNEGGGYQITFGPTPHWLHHCHPRRRKQQKQKQKQQKSVTHQPAPQPLAAAAGNISETAYHEGGGANSSPFNPQTPRRKRGHLEDSAKKTVERRQKRMIKNRESAARSRARKQAYTNELENKVSRLEEENQRLRKNNELDVMIHHIPLPDPKQQLRRTNSTPF
ncbi:ABSCISIC ACID-INSENSITIVE 5-like protein 3 [Zingiber officinale]|uniref:ABSCISIC ACID-INSENSITIVE 5-like protein 3 n=1 Tax=Zingiber officinale TaxID=94328 RepID=UPI001C4D627F|nr:ABSCISIC ACID-INSENSITIVE 5-like protein 3 [Zingiber officinale]